MTIQQISNALSENVPESAINLTNHPVEPQSEHLSNKVKEQTLLQGESMTRRQVPELESLLAKVTCGVSVRNILEAIASKEIVFQGTSVASNLKLIEEIVKTDYRASEVLNSIRNSESILEKVFSYIPIFGKPTKSDAHLARHSDLIDTIEELKKHGILKVSSQYVVGNLGGGRLGLVTSSTIFFTSIGLTDFGHKLLEG